jgi:hypothetical protein
MSELVGRKLKHWSDTLNVVDLNEYDVNATFVNIC